MQPMLKAVEETADPMEPARLTETPRQPPRERSDRLTKSPWTLIAQAAGGPTQLLGKIRGLHSRLRYWVDPAPMRERIDCLVDKGLIDIVPTHLQLLVGSIDMLRFWINPTARDYYAQQDINYWFHQLLRFLDDPGSLSDPLGFASDRDTIIGHVLQVVHANPRYDLQLLDSFPDGIDQLELQTQAMLNGTHPRFDSISAVIEDTTYFPRLLGYIETYRQDPAAEPPLRDNIVANEAFLMMERTFGSLPSTMRYMAQMPNSPSSALEHLFTVRTFPEHLGAQAP